MLKLTCLRQARSSRRSSHRAHQGRSVPKAEKSERAEQICLNETDLRACARPSTRCAQHPRGRRTRLLRKEVIQPHLPIRLPCYDLAPLTGHTFGDSLPCGLGHRLRVQPTQVT